MPLKPDADLLEQIQYANSLIGKKYNISVVHSLSKESMYVLGLMKKYLISLYAIISFMNHILNKLIHFSLSTGH